MSWPTALAAEKAETAYRYVADVYPKNLSYGPLDAHTGRARGGEGRGLPGVRGGAQEPVQGRQGRGQAGRVSERKYEDYEELAQLLGDAETAVAGVQGKLMDMFPVEAVDEGYRLPAPSRYDRQALDIQLALGRLQEELELERRNEFGAPETPEGR